jgi:hypothetical protein
VINEQQMRNERYRSIIIQGFNNILIIDNKAEGSLQENQTLNAQIGSEALWGDSDKMEKSRIEVEMKRVGMTTVRTGEQGKEYKEKNTTTETDRKFHAPKLQAGK